jgi:O-acetyl-ADP-ribose deacetylase (regulator of RNase III)
MKTIEGNLLDFPNGINMIFHQANTENVMGAGIAKQIRERYPEAYKVDKDYYVPKGKPRLGHYTQALINGDSKEHKLVVNLYGQRLGENSIWGFPTNYFALRDALKSYLNDHTAFFSHYKAPICGFPYEMGCGLGGGDWKIVESIIEESLTEFNIEGYIIKL